MSSQTKALSISELLSISGALTFTGGFLLLSVGISGRAQAADFSFSYAGSGISANGTIAAIPFDPVSNTYSYATSG